MAAARAAAADDFVYSLPAGYDTELGPQGVGLSGGQRQRIGIARTLLRDPALLVLDEPTTALDRDNEARVMDGLAELMRGRTTILITHSLELARGADRVVVMRDGRIVADGAPGEVIPDEGSFRRLADGPSPGAVAAPRPGHRPGPPRLAALLDPARWPPRRAGRFPRSGRSARSPSAAWSTRPASGWRCTTAARWTARAMTSWPRASPAWTWPPSWASAATRRWRAASPTGPRAASRCATIRSSALCSPGCRSTCACRPCSSPPPG